MKLYCLSPGCTSPMPDPPNPCPRCGTTGATSKPPVVTTGGEIHVHPRAVIDFTTRREVVSMSQVPPEVSPTGAPVLPNWIPPVAAALVAAAAAVQQVASPHTLAFQIAGLVVAFGAAFGIVSQGARKKQ